MAQTGGRRVKGLGAAAKVQTSGAQALFNNAAAGTECGGQTGERHLED